MSPGVPDPAKAGVSALVQSYNLALNAFALGLQAQLGIDIWTFDVFGLLAANGGSWLDSAGGLGIDPGESALTCLNVPACV